MREHGPSPRTIIAVVPGAAVVLFGALNSRSVTIHWLVATSGLPPIAVIIGCGLLRVAAGGLSRAVRHDTSAAGASITRLRR